MEEKESLLKNEIFRIYSRFHNPDESNLARDKGFNDCIEALRVFIQNSELSEEKWNKKISQDEVMDILVDYFYKSRINLPDDLREHIKTDSRMQGEKYVRNIIKDCLKNPDMGYWYYSGDYITEKILKSYVSKVISEKAKEISNLPFSFDSYKMPDGVNGLPVVETIMPAGVGDIQVNEIMVNDCAEQLFGGTQTLYQNLVAAQMQNEINRFGKLTRTAGMRPRVSYSLGNNNELTAVADIGDKEKMQKACVLIGYYPDKPECKILIVTDGKDNDIASQEVAKQMLNWFESLPAEYMKEENIEALKRDWNERLHEIHENIKDNYDDVGTSFVGAIVGENTTLIASTGDSRCYVLDNDNELKQITIDDTAKFQDWFGASGFEDYTEDKDMLRFKTEGNEVRKSIGKGEWYSNSVQFHTMPNKYKYLMLFNSAIQCLADSEIAAITQETKPADLAKTIIDRARTKKENKWELAHFRGYTPEIKGGDKNVATAIYNNNRIKGGDEK